MMRFAIFIIFIILISCTSFRNNDKINLKFDSYLRIFPDYNLLYFRDKNDTLYYVISKIKNNFNINSNDLDSLVQDHYYELELDLVKKGIYLGSTVRGHQLSFQDLNGQYITKNDTLVGTVYASPNIIGVYYKK